LSDTDTARLLENTDAQALHGVGCPVGGLRHRELLNVSAFDQSRLRSDARNTSRRSLIGHAQPVTAYLFSERTKILHIACY
jgi:hypothetical protein